MLKPGLVSTVKSMDRDELHQVLTEPELWVPLSVLDTWEHFAAWLAEQGLAT